uniref:Protein kinase domain-containing protein n=1 Tax=Timema poppense TaxID=170557 RepID=A0A7R9CLF1_TIMPO|nr:unnamed protein product [Timema poppensis]
MRPHEVQVREFEVLKKVKHENIVKLLAIEEEQEGRGKVIVMELCTGGSLFNILDDPENTYGLQEKEFLLVLEHLSAGMKHLRDNNLVHRDLKPGNIMKFIAEDGRTIFKLTDFGAARELEEDQQFASLYGTEEYLHPDMYERAVLRKSVIGKKFGATVDLWSIGVTLYHVATGVISGTQNSENGPIEWGRELPINCQLSAGLKKLVTPLLAGLLEVDSQRIWSFDRFFSEVTSTLSCKIVHVFHINKAHSIRIYLHPEETYEEFKCLVMEQTDVSPSNQIILYQDTSLLSVIDECTAGRGYPSTKEEDPMMLFSRENNNVTLAQEGDLPKFPSFPNLVSVENDASLAKTACSVGHECKRRIEKLSRSSKLTHACVERFTSLVCLDLERVATKCNKLCEITKCTVNMTEASARGQKTFRELLKVLGHSETMDSELNLCTEVTTLNQELVSELAPAIHQLHQRYVTEKTLRREWSAATRGLLCPAESRSPARARTLIDRLRDSWQHLLRDRATRNLTYNDEQFHVLERIKVSETGRRVKTLFETECRPAVAQLADCLADWYKMAQTVYLQARILDKDVDTFEHRLDTFSRRSTEADCIFHNSLQEVLQRVTVDGKIAPRTPGRQTRGRESAKKFRNSIKDIRVVQEEISSVLKENSDLVSKFHNLAFALNRDEASNGEDK